MCVSVNDGAETLIETLALAQFFSVYDEKAVGQTQISAAVHLLTPQVLSMPQSLTLTGILSREMAQQCDQ